MTSNERMTKVAEVAVRWLSGQLTADKADDMVFDIVCPPSPTDDDIELHIMEIWDSIEYTEITFWTEGI